MNPAFLQLVACSVGASEGKTLRHEQDGPLFTPTLKAPPITT